MPPPIGTLVHALGHNWLGKADIAVQTVLLAAGFAIVGLRLWSRRLQRAPWQVNDWLILAAAVRSDTSRPRSSHVHRDRLH
jgi:hypothetical protein